MIGTTYTLDASLDSIIDEADPAITYIGYARVMGAATSAAIWRIKRIKVSGTTTFIGWADSDDNFDNIWDNRASLTYSQG